MSLDAEHIADRRRLRRKVSFWRVVGLVALAAVAVVAGLRFSGTGGGLTEVGVGGQIARVSVGGFISNDRRMEELFRRLEEANAVRGVIVSIDSPGGSTTGAEELYRGIRRLAERKPTVAFVEGTAASGGYIAALGADRIIARETSLVGSIGVLFQFPEFNQLLDRLGVKVEEIKSSPLKAAPSGFTPTTPEARAALQEVVNDTYAWFKDLVARRRNYDAAALEAVSQGRVYSGRQALELRLIDAVGSETDAIRWLEAERGLARDLPVRNWRPRREPDGFNFFTTGAVAAELMGLDTLAARLHRIASAGERLRVDGLLALWQPVAEK